MNTEEKRMVYGAITSENNSQNIPTEESQKSKVPTTLKGLTRKQLLKKKGKLEEGIVKTGAKEYNLLIPEYMDEELQELAESECTTVEDIIRRSIKLGLVAANLEKEQGAKLIIQRPGETDERLLFLA